MNQGPRRLFDAPKVAEVCEGWESPRSLFVKIVSRDETMYLKHRLSLAGSFRGAGEQLLNLIQPSAVRVVSSGQQEGALTEQNICGQGLRQIR